MSDIVHRRVLLPRAAARVHRYWYPLLALVRRDVKKRYATTIVGVGWTVLHPLVLLGIYVVAFGFILRPGGAASDGDGFVFYLLTGMLPFLAIAEGLQRAATSLREDRALLDREQFPAEVVPAARVIGSSLAEVGGLAILALIGAVLGWPLDGWLVLLPVLVVLRIQLTLGIAWIVSTLAVFVSDLSEILSLLLTAWLFLTPIFYAPALVPPALRWTLSINPLHHLVEAYRSVLLTGSAPFPELLWLAAWSGAVYLIGVRFFRKTIARGKDFL